MATISLVMIVKNEEKTLQACLESVKPIVDEFVIVDTGSTDGTKEIIRQYGPVYEVEFTNFRDTKNYACSLATGDYLLVMDADERIVEGLWHLKEAAEAGLDAVAALIVEGAYPDRIINQYYRVRMAKRTWRFAGNEVHEVLDGDGQIVFRKDVVVYHDHSHRTAESYAERAQKYVEILSQYPNDPRAVFYLARTYKDMGRHLSAIAAYERYIQMNTSFRDERWQAAYDAALCAKALGEYQMALEYIQRCFSIDPRRAEAYVLAGEIFFNLQRYRDAERMFRQAIRPIPEDVILFLNPSAYHDLPYDWLTVVYDKMRRYRDAREACAKLKHIQDMRIVNNLVYLGRKCHLKWFFCLGRTPEPIRGDMLDATGAGGVETTYIELPTELARLGHDVFVFGRCDYHHHQGVRYIPWEDLEKWADLYPDVVVTSRWFSPLYTLSGVKVIWLQDAYFADPDSPDAWDMADHVVVSSPWHRSYLAERIGTRVHSDKIHVIPLSIRKELFLKSVPRDPLKVIYSSNPDRGLEILASMWGEIEKRVPGIHLTVAYGWEGLETWNDTPEWKEQVRERKERILSALPRARFTGRLSKPNLAMEMLSSSLCLYPCNFWETFCLTALETQAAGVPMVTTRMGALATTLSHDANVLIHGDPYSAEYQQAFIEHTERLMKDHSMRSAMSRMATSFAMRAPSWQDVARVWESMVWGEPSCLSSEYSATEA